jgi:hypothetical protein
MNLDMSKFTDREPKPDIAKCSNCGWRGKASMCEQETEGDFEGGYYQIDLCPKCEDGCIDDYSMSFLRWIRWEYWHWKEEIKKKFTSD